MGNRITLDPIPKLTSKGTETNQTPPGLRFEGELRLDAAGSWSEWRSVDCGEAAWIQCNFDRKGGWTTTPSLMDMKRQKDNYTGMVCVSHTSSGFVFLIEVFTSSVIVFFFFWGRGSLRAWGAFCTAYRELIVYSNFLPPSSPQPTIKKRLKRTPYSFGQKSATTHLLKRNSSKS